jgi:probable rRNA maturation factor
MRRAKSALPALRQRHSERRRGSDVQLTVQYATRAQPLPSERNLRKWVKAALSADARLTVRLVGLSEGRTLNREYRGKDYATNVLTFVLDEGPPYDGDLALCAPVVTREARAQRKDIMAHYAHLTVHGVLHLQGYEHEREAEAAAMEKLETRILKRLGFRDPYAPVSEHGRHPQ